jgi:phage/conjugal plasmid C-4 type zinc finger TraR family protein
MIDKEFEYNNEEEAEMAQIHSIHLHMNAVANVQRQLEKQRQMVSAEDCVECGEPIPEARRLAVPGVQLCIYCKSKSEQRV